MSRRRRPTSYVIEAARGNLFGEKTRRPPSIRKQVTRDLAQIGRGAARFIVGGKKRRSRRK